MSEKVKMVIEVTKDIAEKYDGKQIEFFKRAAGYKYDKMIKTVARLFDPKKDIELLPGRPDVTDPDVIKDLLPKL